MNNLEKLKEINPYFYDAVKLKYATNVENLKQRLEDIPFETYAHYLKAVKTVPELEQIEEIMRLNKLIDQEREKLRRRDM